MKTLLVQYTPTDDTFRSFFKRGMGRSIILNSAIITVVSVACVLLMYSGHLG